MQDHRSASRRGLYVLVLFCVIAAAPLSAQQPSPPPSSPATQAPPTAPGATGEKKPDYGQWWLVNAREVNPPPPGWLVHSEGQGSFANSTGSVSGFQYIFNALSAQRKGLVTNHAAVSLTVQEQRLEDDRGFFKQTTERFFDMVLINITKPLNLGTVVLWEKDQPKFVIHRVAILEGLMRSWALGKGRFSVTGAIGHESEHLFSPAAGAEVDEGNPLVYFQNTYNAPIAMKGMFSHFIETFVNLTDRQDVRVMWNLGLNLQVTPHIGIGPTAQIRYDSQPVTQVQTTDTMVMIAVQFNK